MPQASPASRFVFHLLPNAHLDPVWLWDWREGLNEGLITVRTILDLMEEFPQLTFIRGESSIYEHIEKTDPATFDRIGELIDSGRWDVVGGTYNQPDTNLSSTETLCRQYEVGLEYFAKRFGVRPHAAWQADSFGHTPGLPNILRSFGMTDFAFTRPNRKDFPMPEPVFWWESDHGDAVLCYRQHYVAYCSERHNLPGILDETLRGASKLPFRNCGILMGLGNHGGGPSRRHIADVEAWAAAHPEVEVRFSTLHGLFGALRQEMDARKDLEIPRLRGDMGFCLRGCYSSVAKLKSAFRRAEALVSQAETAQAVIGRSLGAPVIPLKSAWEGVLFNSFHDILPGSSIERALDEQMSWIGHAAHQAQAARFAALNHLAREIDTSVPPAHGPDQPADVPLLVWNPLPRNYKGWVELEACMDYRPNFKFPASVGSLPLRVVGPDGREPAFQEVPTEHTSMRDGAWRKRVVFQTELPALGWKVFRLGLRGNAAKATSSKAGACTARRGKSPAVASKDWKVAVTAKGQIRITWRGRDFFAEPGGIGVRVVEDGWGSWGGMLEEPGSFQLDSVRETWSVRESAILEEGPERAKLWTRWQGANSWLDLTFSVARNAREIRVEGRLLWNERSARLQLVLPSSGFLYMQVPASRIERDQPGTLPCGRWIRRGGAKTGIGFVSDVLSDVAATPGETLVTLARASRYADDVLTPADKDRWMPAVDCGELKFQFLLAPGGASLEHLAQEFLAPPVALCVPAHPGKMPRAGSLARVEPGEITLLAAQIEDDGALRLRVQNLSDRTLPARLVLCGSAHDLGSLDPGEISTLILSAGGKATGRRGQDSPKPKLESIGRNGAGAAEGRHSSNGNSAPRTSGGRRRRIEAPVG